PLILLLAQRGRPRAVAVAAAHAARHLRGHAVDAGHQQRRVVFVLEELGAAAALGMGEGGVRQRWLVAAMAAAHRVKRAVAEACAGHLRGPREAAAATAEIIHGLLPHT
ncbi:MAG: hypothetical protein ACK56I_12465, partial [bacterium]